jgi:hypothetical protein
VFFAAFFNKKNLGYKKQEESILYEKKIFKKTLRASIARRRFRKTIRLPALRTYCSDGSAWNKAPKSLSVVP